MSIRDAIKEASKSKPKLAEHTLFDGRKVWIRPLSGKGRAAFSAYQEKAKANGGVKPEVVAALALCEEDGTLAYDWENAEDIAELAALHEVSDDLDRIGLKLFEISGLTEKAQEEAAKN